MKIHFITRTPIPGRSAAAMNIVQSCNALAQAGVDLTLVRGLKPHRPSLLFSPIEEMFGTRPIFKVRQFVDIPRFERLFYGWAMIHAKRADALAFVRDPAAVSIARKQGVPCVLELHLVPDSAMLDSLERVISSLRLIVCITSAIADEVVRLRPALKGLLCVLPDAVDPSRFNFSAMGRPARPSAGYVGSFYPGKGAETVLELARQLPDVTFHLIGGGRLGDLAPTDVPPNLVMHGFVSPKNIPGIYDLFDIGLLPNSAKVILPNGADIGAGTSPLKLFEYFAAGKAMVASDLPVLREVLQDEVNSLLVPPGKVEMWGAAIRRLLDEPVLFRRLVSNGRAAAVGEYSYERRTQRMISLLQSVPLDSEVRK